MTDSREIRPLIDADELALAVGSADPPIVLDIRWAAGKVQRDAYLAGHIPGAVFLDLDRDLAAPPGAGGRHPLPEPIALQTVWRRVGITGESAVVVYDSKDSSVAARAWWLLRWSGLTDVRVLDGGFAGWSQDPDRAIAQGERPDPVPGSVTVTPGGMPVVDADGAAALATGTGVLLDARAAARYRGEIEPLDPIAGHIPGAANLPLTDLLHDDGTFLAAARISDRIDAAVGSDGTGDVAASCGSGVTACHLILAGALVGRKIALYPGSYSGWLALGRPVAVGAEPGGHRHLTF
ncbi:thiosulfate/3-mercaptopyruvate sulfurtransferase [Nakamurella sp. UYEF19]|uniref:sulfurtransferase n=1 Tax=Nakamurella sp. UYEF19 TaxID=1756392 RepID=UPI00339B45E5